MSSSPDAALPLPPNRPVRKDEIELHDRGIYIESWLPERRSRRKPLLFIHGELGGSWLWERFLGYFAGRGWEGHALNLRNHHWSQTADPAELSFESFVEDVGVPQPHPLHVSLLAGLLSHIGLWDPDKRDYAGARGARFALWPGYWLVGRCALFRPRRQWPRWPIGIPMARRWGR